jgi:hypothetical protein
MTRMIKQAGREIGTRRAIRRILFIHFNDTYLTLDAICELLGYLFVVKRTMTAMTCRDHLTSSQ